MSAAARVRLTRAEGNGPRVGSGWHGWAKAAFKGVPAVSLLLPGSGLQSESLNALPFGAERKGIRLLLVVHCGAGEFLALRIGAAYGDSAALAVSGDDYATASGDLAPFLNVEPQRMVVNLRVRPHVRIRIARDGVVFAVELASPLVVRGFTFAIGAIHSDFHGPQRIRHS